MFVLSQLQEALIKIISNYHYISTAEEPSSDLSQEHQFIATMPIDIHLEELINASTKNNPEARPLLDKIFSNIKEMNSSLAPNKTIKTEQLEPLYEKLCRLFLELKTICARPEETNSIYNKALIDLIKGSFDAILCQSESHIQQHIHDMLINYQEKMEYKNLSRQVQELLNENAQLKLQNTLLKEKNDKLTNQLDNVGSLPTPAPKSHQRAHCLITNSLFVLPLPRSVLANNPSDPTEFHLKM